MTKRAVSQNYINDSVYGSRYNEYLNPLNLHYIGLHAGLRQGRLGADFSYCDLGCGDGTTLNVVASMYPEARFYGIDFNGEHVARARKQAQSAVLTNVEYRQLDFADLHTIDLPQLDFVSCFGTFSWINRSLQDAIFDFVGASLANKGVFVVHYASEPGKTQIDPLWHLVRMASQQKDQPSTERVRVGVELVDALRETGAQFFKDNPIALARSHALAGQDLNYLAHEALSEWQAFHHSDIVARAHERGLQFAGLYTPADNDSDFAVPDVFRPTLEKYVDPVVRTTVEDYILNRGIRTDVYIKAKSRAATGDISHQPVWLNNPKGDIAPFVKLPSGKEISFRTSLYETIASEMRSQVCSVADLHRRPTLSSYGQQEISAAVAKLVASGQASPVIGSPVPATAKSASSGARPTLKITEDILRHRIALAGNTYLPSPLIGQCVSVDRIVALSLSALAYQPGTEQDWVAEQLKTTDNQDTTIWQTTSQANNAAKQALQGVVREVLPVLIRLGIYS